VNLRLTDAGWRLVSVPDAEVHHKFAASNLRRVDRVPRSLYLIARSKSYFCWVNAAGSYSEAEIQRELLRFRDENTGKIECFLKRRKIDRPTAQRLLAEVQQGLADGKRDATSPRKLPSLPLDGDGEAFVPYGGRNGRLRICLILRRFARDTAAQKAVTDLAARHEVTVIHRARSRLPTVDFQDGVWLHGVKPPPIDWINLLSPGRRFAAAAAAEVLRIQPRRQFHLVADPETEVDNLRGLDLPVVRMGPEALEEYLIEATPANIGAVTNASRGDHASGAGGEQPATWLQKAARNPGSENKRGSWRARCRIAPNNDPAI
jgi:glycogen(starch) synthase